MIRVSKQHPCPVCGRPDWCGIAEDGVVAVCMRVESNQTAKNGGWVHVIRLNRKRKPVSAAQFFKMKRMIFNNQLHCSLTDIPKKTFAYFCASNNLPGINGQIFQWIIFSSFYKFFPKMQYAAAHKMPHSPDRPGDTMDPLQ